MEKIITPNFESKIINIKQNGNLLTVKFPEFVNLSDVDLRTIELFTDGGTKCTGFNGYITIYKLIDDDNMVILSNDGSVYVEPTPPPTVEPHIPTPEEIALQLESAKKLKIQQTNDLLERYLYDNPIQFTDGLYYSVTKDKQNLLSARLLSYQLELQSGITNPELTWNSTGEICVEWTFENLVTLALTIKNYVEPLVKKQQIYEKQILQCATTEELGNVVIDYETVN